MKKRQEKRIKHSCWNKAKKNERVFVLLERDEASPSTIRFWASQRIRLGKNQATDAQIEGALKIAAKMEAQQKKDMERNGTARPQAKAVAQGDHAAAD